MNKYLLNRQDTLLLLVDVQERLVPVMWRKKELVKNLKILLTAFDYLKIPMLATEQYPRGLGSTLASLKEKIKGPIFEKISFSAYQGEIKKALDGSDKSSIILVGIESHICVFQTARDLLAAGYQVFVLLDGTDSRSRSNHENGLDLMREMGAVVTNLETVLFDLLKEAGTDEFKMISKLIK